ncbi:hypothetical protein C7999DRAFT_16826 [Corynascus novoguineensis]|uniref:SET domain-containing protein n=1 Tax=Corynascus novoguineensis TaxID=1126955 RepID=A0AAN7HKI5_9PEZI|nr:hypothetical protein C7999DRAFT_16826 [Corynascus novoguineensis]
MNQYDESRFSALLEWSQQHGARLHPSLEIYLDPISKYSLRVKPSASHSLQPGFDAVTCPAGITLSYLNALVDGPLDPSAPLHQRTGAFPARFTQAVPPYVLGRFFLIKEYLKGKSSFWWPYIATLPSPEQVAAWALPPFWPDQDIAYLEGTNAHVAIQEIQANVKREFKQARKLLKEEGFPDLAAYTQLLYKWSFSIFTSRSFRPSLILSDATKQYISTFLPQGVQLDDFSILQPLLDVANHSPTARYTWDTTSVRDACQLVCHDPYEPGAQVYNNYGLKTNSELLLAYGFLLPETSALHNDYVHVRKRPQQQQQQQQQQEELQQGEKVVDPQKGAAQHGGSDDTPQSFLISLRPLAHPSSLVGRARLSTTTSSPLASLPCFAHFEPALVDDLAAAMATPEEREALQRWSSPPPPEEVKELVDKVRGMLGGKVQLDYGKLMEEEEEDDDDGGGLPPPGNRNQTLAAEYREQCAKVLIAAMEGLTVQNGL